jgi:uncharacterized protein (DUF427 family)
MKTYTTKTEKEVGFEKSPKWVRVRFGNEYVADSKRAYLLIPGGIPFYYFPKEDVRMGFLEPNTHHEHSDFLGDAIYWNVKANGKVAENAAWSYPGPVSDSLDLSGFIAFNWDKMDGWFEEAEEVFVHPHDPYHRIDTLQSTRHIKVVILDEMVAESRSPVLLFETGLPTRYYLPKLDVRLELLEPSDRTSGCAYKGQAQYYSARIGDQLVRDICWYYRYPTSPMAKIAARIAFFNERVDLYVDGEKQGRPETMWSEWGT